MNRRTLEAILFPYLAIVAGAITGCDVAQPESMMMSKSATADTNFFRMLMG
jgi:hypothetical protein